jgi:hypothetical protein
MESTMDTLHGEDERDTRALLGDFARDLEALLDRIEDETKAVRLLVASTLRESARHRQG